MKSEYKKRYNPDTGRYVKKHIYSGELHGEGYKMDMLKSLGKKLFGKTTQEIAKKAVEKATTSVATKTGEHLGNRAGDKIVQMLSKKTPKKTVKKQIDIEPSTYTDYTFSLKTPVQEKPKTQVKHPMTSQEIAQRVNQLISGGRIKKKRIV